MATKKGSKLAKLGGSKVDILGILGWVGTGTGLAMDLVERVSKLKSSKDKDEYIATMDEKIDQLGTATVKLDEKTACMQEQLDATRKEVQVLKKIILGMGIALGVAIIAIVVSFLI